MGPARRRERGRASARQLCGLQGQANGGAAEGAEVAKGKERGYTMEEASRAEAGGSLPAWAIPLAGAVGLLLAALAYLLFR